MAAAVAVAATALLSSHITALRSEIAELRGSVVGMSVATAKGSQSVGFALPVSRVKAALAAQGI